MENFMEPWVLWTVIGLGFLLLEFVLPGLIIFFFGLGALFVGLLCGVTDLSLNMQLLCFLVSSALFLFLLRRWVSSVFSGFVLTGNSESVSSDEFVGDHGVVVEPIQASKRGKIELNGSNWNAESDESIDTGERVEVISRSSLVLRVKKI